MTVDVDRPPARIGPRLPFWAKLLLLWAAMAVVLALILLLLTSANGAAAPPRIVPALAFGLVSVAIIASVIMRYSRLRFASDGSILSSVLAARGMSVGDPEGGVRPSDPEERLARRRWKRGAISRREYERIIAYRHLVHGEISHAQYTAIVGELEENPTDPRKGARPPPGP